MADLPPAKERACGAGEIIASSHGKEHAASKISKLHSSYPLRLISPRSAPESHAALVFMLTFGGGLVAGDRTNLNVHVTENARLGLLTQGSTRVYKSPSLSVVTSQTLHAKAETGSALLLLPDPVQPFKDSVFEQRQTIEMDPATSSLLLLDWVSEGRSSRGEAWLFSKWQSKIEIRAIVSIDDTGTHKDGRLLLRDNIKLDSTSGPPLQASMENLGVFGTLIISGPLFEKLGNFFLDTFKALPRVGEKIWTDSYGTNGSDQATAAASHAGPDTGLTWTATTIRGFIIVKFGASAVEHARRWLRAMLVQDGTVETEFGHQYLYCLQDR